MVKIAPESEKIRRAREKLEKKLSKLDAQVNKQALMRKNREIHRWIERHAASRIILQNKSIALFDENQSPAKLSRKVEGVAATLQELLKQA
ncbi:MAG: hypothetical protein H7A40_01455 [Chlamydiales bacterium]|nr:hypothetical protein [Chlamydiales bacterium]